VSAPRRINPDEETLLRIRSKLKRGFSTGGLIALGLVTQNWTIEDCLYHFERICSKAFSHHTKRAIPVVGWIRERYKSKSETSAFEAALKGAFSESQHLFGDPRPSGKLGSHIKVAVTAASSAGRTVVLGNYNRRTSKKGRSRII
jgi:hypothetical protein